MKTYNDNRFVWMIHLHSDKLIVEFKLNQADWSIMSVFSHAESWKFKNRKFARYDSS